MTNQIDALKLALEALDALCLNDYSGYEMGKRDTHLVDTAIDAIKAALAQPAQQEPVAWLDEEKKIIYWHNTHETDDYHGFKRTTPLYTTPPAQPEERNFCSRCGKRTADLTVIHTCTPPQRTKQCWKCGDMDAVFQDKCDVPACGMKDQP